MFPVLKPRNVSKTIPSWLNQTQQPPMTEPAKAIELHLPQRCNQPSPLLLLDWRQASLQPCQQEKNSSVLPRPLLLQGTDVDRSHPPLLNSKVLRSLRTFKEAQNQCIGFLVSNPQCFFSCCQVPTLHPVGEDAIAGSLPTPINNELTKNPNQQSAHKERTCHKVGFKPRWGGIITFLSTTRARPK